MLSDNVKLLRDNAAAHHQCKPKFSYIFFIFRIFFEYYKEWMYNIEKKGYFTKWIFRDRALTKALNVYIEF